MSGLLHEDAKPAQQSAAAPDRPRALTIGTLVDGKYQIDKLLGEGGMGVVYLARDIHTAVPVVVKAIRTEYAHQEEFRARILEEGRVLARIDHPNVVRLNAVVVEAGALYLVMQFIEGEALDHRIERYANSHTPMPVQEVLNIFRQVLQGVGAAHCEGVIHRDLKPANILIRARDGVAKVTDFGIAKVEEDAKAGKGQTRGIIGSLLYMAPEQISGHRDLDKRVDIYALGILLFELLTGRVPFDAPSEYGIMKLHLEAAIPPIVPMRHDVDPFIDSLIQRACAKNRNERFPSCEEFLEALDRGLAGSKVPTIGQAVHATDSDVQPAPANASRATSAMNWVEAGTTGPRSLPVAPEPRSRLKGVLLVASIVSVGLVGAGLGAGYSAGWFGGQHRNRPGLRRTSPSASASSIVVKPDASPPQNPLASMVGMWKSDTGRNYDAVLSGDVLEFRVRDPAEFPGQGYQVGEARFSLTALSGEQRTFAVEDKIRPIPPVGKSYAPQARPTCQEVWSAVDNRPLRAQFDGKRLTVDMVKLVPLPEMFETETNKVTGCKGLRGAKSSKIESTYTRT